MLRPEIIQQPGQLVSIGGVCALTPNASITIRIALERIRFMRMPPLKTQLPQSNIDGIFVSQNKQVNPAYSGASRATAYSFDLGRSSGPNLEIDLLQAFLPRLFLPLRPARRR